MKKSNRRGVLLLVVLALLAMFAMVAVAFVVLTGVEKVNANRLKTIGQADEVPDKTLEQGFDVVMRGTYVNPNTINNALPSTSAIKWQSLLEKEYGFETIGTLNAPAQMSQTTRVCGGQLIEFTLPATNPDTTTFGGAAIDPFHYVGCVVTMLTGQAAGLSTRIVGIDPQTVTSTPVRVQMAAFDGGVQPAAGDNYIVNGFPYSGMGFGFNPATGAMTQTALMPNAPPASWYGSKGIIAGGVNSDYTAPDYQDPLLALAVPNPNIRGGILVPIPSLHRSDLIQHVNASGNIMSNATLLRQVMFRPNSLDHPNFTGSNPKFNPLWDGITPGQGAWDVDNDGDGVPDSVWVDLGLPVRYTSDGRAYKPLFAILCLDMDGRLNINAHGSYAQTQSGYYQAPNAQQYQPLASPQGSGATLDIGLGTTLLPPAIATMATNRSFAGPVGQPLPTPQIALPRGQGTGPAEVNLLPLFRNPAAPTNFLWTNYQALLSGSGGLMGRYGTPTAGGVQIGGALPGINGTGSPLTLNHAFPYNGVMGGNYWKNFQTIFDAHGSPPDPQTFGAVGLDRAGRPLYISFGGPVANGPYDIDLSLKAPHAVDSAVLMAAYAAGQPTAADNPFGVAEAERIFRPFDRDAFTLPQRLFNLTSSGGTCVLQTRRAEFTPVSSYVPVASAVLPPALRNSLPGKRSTHPVDIIAGKLGSNTGNLNSMRTQLLPWEILQGLKMNLNRPFGPGAFSTAANGSLIQGGSKTIPDQPGSSGETLKQLASASGGPVTAKFNYAADGGLSTNSGGSGVTDSLAARQLYARHLYVLMMALADTNALLKDLQKSTPTATSDDVARLIAQWAVNVVAYRDHNSVMIPFPYDPNPFSGRGWSPANTPQYTVWGCKRPELLITETLAFHDRRTQDLDNEVVDKTKPGRTATQGTDPGKTTDTGKKKDPSFNSGFRPQGSLFVELYNPWTALEPRTTDLGANPATGPSWPNGGVELTKKTPNVNGKSSPVWRLVIVVPTPAPPAPMTQQPNGDELPDPDNPVVGSRPVVERAAYFVSLAGMTTPADGQVSYCPSGNNAASLVVPPSGYAVVGSGDNNQANRTFVGFEVGKSVGSPTSTRMVTMNKADLADARVVRNTADPAPAPRTPIPQVLGIDSPQRLSISEPVKGYTQYEKDAKGNQAIPSPATGQYNNGKSSLDIPVDQQRDLIGHENVWSILNANNTVPAFRIIYLQRLADPTRPWAADTTGTVQQWNPYRTVDAMTVDLATFNGVTSDKDPTSTNGAYSSIFEAHQRGEQNYLPGNPPPAGQAGEVNLWKQEPADKSKHAPPGWSKGGSAANGNHYFTLALNQTLGYLNRPYAPLGTPPSAQPGDPPYPFPWLNWSYRPFHNEYELLQVSTLSSSRLLARNVTDPRRYFSYVDQKTRATINGGQPQPVYDPPTTASAQFPNPSDRIPYPHLLDFFESGQSSQAGLSAQLHRLFAYVGVPSRFANAQIQISPVQAGQTGAGTAPHWFHTPFNRISWYREPGRINLNTVTSSDVLLGAMNMYFPPLQQNSQLNAAFWDKFVRSRASDGVGGPVSGTSNNPAQQTQQSLNNMLQINPKWPSRFMRPYRTPGGAALTTAAGNTSAEPPRETEVTLLRGDPDVLTTSGSTARPLFEIDDYLMGSTASAATPDKFATSNGVNLACMDFDRNPYFRYQAIQKLGSVFSTHSNVFAIWITVGYFEVLPNRLNGGQPDAGHPDGWELGEELGSDSGDTIRHRAFYIIDRSIPVGFVRGQDINHGQAVLLRRFIE